MKPAPVPRPLAFRARLERIAMSAEYYAFTLPAKASAALGTRGPVPVSVRLNQSVPYTVSLAPIGGGRHWLRVNAKARAAAGIKGGEFVRVRITVLDRAKRIALPADLKAALRAGGAETSFRAQSLGLQNFIVRGLNAAVRSGTRAKRIQDAVQRARRRKLPRKGVPEDLADVIMSLRRRKQPTRGYRQFLSKLTRRSPT